MTSFWMWSRVLLAVIRSKSNQEFYDRISPIYDRCFVKHKLHADKMAELLRDLFRGRKNNTLIVDVGCGTGLLSKILVSNGFEVIGVDISLESLRVLQQRESKICVIQADAILLPIIDDACNSVVSLGAWRHFSDPRRVIEEVVRILKKDGTLIVGYFPPAIGGIIQLRQAPWYQMLSRLYKFLIHKRGYVDQADLSLEPATISELKNHFVHVDTVDSGGRGRLVVAQGLKHP